MRSDGERPAAPEELEDVEPGEVVSPEIEVPEVVVSPVVVVASVPRGSLPTAGNTGTKFCNSSIVRLPSGEMRTGFSPGFHSKANPSFMHRLPSDKTQGESFKTMAVVCDPVLAIGIVVS